MTIGAIVLSDGLGIVLPAALVVWLLRHRRDYVVSADLTRAGNVIAKGVVEADSAPVTIEYEEERYEMSQETLARDDGTTVYRWDEEERRIKAKPFVLRTANLRIQVEPDEDDVELVWNPDHTEKLRTRRRIRRCILEPGAHVEIFGAFRPAPTTGEPYREGAALPTLAPSRAERLLISKGSLAPQVAAMTRYLRARAMVVAAATCVAHLAFDPVLKADLAQLGLAMPTDVVRTWIGVGFGVIAIYFWRIKRPFYEGRLSERQVI